MTTDLEERMTEAPSVLILGIGNLLWSDESFGVKSLAWLGHRDEFASNDRWIDDAAQGIYRLRRRRDAEIPVIFDAVEYGLTESSLKGVEGVELPRLLGAKKASRHQTWFQ